MNEIELQKRFNSAIKKSHDDSKLDYCLCCGKKVSSFCNSHSLPKFILRNISKDGFVLTSNNYFKMSLMDKKTGLNKSGTFKRICNDCDDIIFKDYESEEQLLIPPRKKIMTLIDLKNCLRVYDKRLNEIALYNDMMAKKVDDFMLQKLIETQTINALDLNEIKEELDRDMKILSKESSSSFKLIFWEKLNYVVPIAFQGHIALVGDLKGNTINNIYFKDDKYRIENINVCVFPLKKESIVMMFISNDNKKYKAFIKQFNSLPNVKKLQLISFMIFNYSEDFFVSSKSKEELINNKDLDVVTQNVTNIYALDEEMANEMKKIKNTELSGYVSFPNLLSKEYSLSVND